MNIVKTIIIIIKNMWIWKKTKDWVSVPEVILLYACPSSWNLFVDSGSSGFCIGCWIINRISQQIIEIKEWLFQNETPLHTRDR